MKIIGLEIENVKRLAAVRIEPDGTLQVIGGRNAQGKSSVIDAIWLALGGGKAGKETSRPIRDGETRASVHVTLDNGLTVTRTWSGESTKLTVTSEDGARFPSPQTMLDSLVGQLTFDPLAFTRLSAREQREALIRMVDLGIDLDALDAERARVYEERHTLGKQGAALGDPQVDTDLPVEEVSIASLLDELAAATEHNEDVRRGVESAASARADISRADDEIAALHAKLEEKKALREHLLRVLEENERAIDELGDEVDTAPLKAQIASAEDVNARVRANNEQRKRATERDALRARWRDKSQELAAIDARKADALSRAEFPVPGLGFDDTGVTLNGIPFSQASSAEQIRVSVAMGMAANPRLRVMFIKDGSLLDGESMEAIRSQVADGDFQLWIERVGSMDEGAVIIEDGQVLA